MKNVLLAALLFSFVLLAGCMGAQQQAAEPNPVQQEPVIEPQKANIGVELMRVPEEAITEGEAFTVAWFVNSDIAKKASRTAVHYGMESMADLPVVDARSYPAFTTPQEGSVPGSYEATVTAGNEDIYLRAMAVVDGKEYWSSERKVSVKVIPLIVSAKITAAPEEINSNLGFDVNWTVESNKQKQVQTMELRYGMQSAPVPDVSTYPNRVLVLPEDGMVPGSFSVHLAPQMIQTILYFRVHVVVDGKEYWSDEVPVRLAQTGWMWPG